MTAVYLAGPYAARARLNAANPAAQPAVTTDELNAPIRQ